MKREDVFHIGPHIGYIKTYNPKKKSGIVTSLNDGVDYSFCDNDLSDELWNQFSEEMYEVPGGHDYARTNSAHENNLSNIKREQDYFANELGLLVVGFKTKKSSLNGNTAVGIQFPEMYIQEYRRNLYCFYTRTGQKRFALSVLFKAVPSFEYLVKYKELCDRHLYLFGNEDQVRYYVESIDPEEIINTFEMYYYFREYSYTPPFGDERTSIDSGINVSYKSAIFPFSKAFSDCYLNHLEEECKKLSSHRTDIETNHSDSLLAREYIRENYSKEKHLESLLERIPIKFSEFNTLSFRFDPVNDVERQTKCDDLSFCINDPMLDKIEEVIQNSPSLKIKDCDEVISFLRA